jgi:hypothetical protein
MENNHYLDGTGIEHQHYDGKNYVHTGSNALSEYGCSFIA